MDEDCGILKPYREQITRILINQIRYLPKNDSLQNLEGGEISFVDQKLRVEHIRKIVYRITSFRFKRII